MNIFKTAVLFSLLTTGLVMGGSAFASNVNAGGNISLQALQPKTALATASLLPSDLLYLILTVLIPLFLGGLGFIRTVRNWRFLSAPFLQTTLSFALVLIGVAASIYSSDIKNSVGYALSGQFSAISSTAWIFWGCFTYSLALYFLSQSASEEREAIRVKELQDLINSVPPKNFLEVYSDQCTQSFIALRDIEATSSITLAQIELGIQSILRLVISAVRYYWWETSADIVYAANIMIFEPASSKSKISFSPPALAVDKLKGLLTIYNGLSATSAEKIGPDKKLPNISLPLYNAADDRIIPGAPEAFVKNAYILVEDTRQKKWLESAQKFDESVRDKIQDYFSNGEGKHIRSFVCPKWQQVINN